MFNRQLDRFLQRQKKIIQEKEKRMQEKLDIGFCMQQDQQTVI
jgi:hypothetical protein